MVKKFLRMLCLSLPIVSMFGNTIQAQTDEAQADVTSRAFIVLRGYQYVMQEGMILQASLSTLPDDANGNRCEDLQGTLRFYGTHRDARTRANSSLERDFPEANKLLLLDETPLRIPRGTVQPIEFLQPFGGSQTVIVEAELPARFEGCLAPSAANIARSDGPVIAIVPPGPPLRRKTMRKVIIGGGVPACYPCVPVCACGTE